MFVIVLKGNVIGSINIGAMKTDPTVNPLYYVIQNNGAKGTTNLIGAPVNGNTVATFSGPAITPGQTNSPGRPSHFGLDPPASNGGERQFTVVTQYWSNSTTKTRLPSLSINSPTLEPTPSSMRRPSLRSPPKARPSRLGWHLLCVGAGGPGASAGRCIRRHRQREGPDQPMTTKLTPFMLRCSAAAQAPR